MKNAILVHGLIEKWEFEDLQYPTPSNSHWFPWLTKRLMINGIHTAVPEMPKSYHPKYEPWKKEFERFDINEDTLLVGYSCGGGFLIRWLSENTDKKVGKVILVAPWVGTDPNREFDASFFDFGWDSNLAERTTGLTMFSSTNDVEPVQKSIRIIKDRLNDLNIIELENKGHFNTEGLGGEAFPELLKECLKK